MKRRRVSVSRRELAAHDRLRELCGRGARARGRAAIATSSASDDRRATPDAVALVRPECRRGGASTGRRHGAAAYRGRCCSTRSGTLLELEPPAPRLRAELRERLGMDVGARGGAAGDAGRDRLLPRAPARGVATRPALAALRRRCAEVLRAALGARRRRATRLTRGAAGGDPLRRRSPTPCRALRALRGAGRAARRGLELGRLAARAARADRARRRCSTARCPPPSSGAAKPDPAIFVRALALAGGRARRAPGTSATLRGRRRGRARRRAARRAGRPRRRRGRARRARPCRVAGRAALALRRVPSVQPDVEPSAPPGLPPCRLTRAARARAGRPSAGPRRRPAAGWPAWAPFAAIARIAGRRRGRRRRDRAVDRARRRRHRRRRPPPGVRSARTSCRTSLLIGAAIVFARAAIRRGRDAAQFGLRPRALWRALGWTLLTCGRLLRCSRGCGLASSTITEQTSCPSDLGVDGLGGRLVAVGVLVCVRRADRGGAVLPRLPASARCGARCGMLAGGARHGRRVRRHPRAAAPPIEFLGAARVFGFLLCLLYRRPARCCPCIVLHALNNALAFGVSQDWGWRRRCR